MANILSPRNRLVRPRGIGKPAKLFLDPLHPLSRGLVGYWPLGDAAAGITQDISPYGKHATVNVTSGAPILGYSHHGGQSLNTNAGTNFCTAKPVATAVPLSFSIWAKLAVGVSGTEQVMMALNAVGSLNEFWIGVITSAGSPAFRAVVQQSGVARWYQIVISGDTNWHHYVAVFNDINTYTLYIDGVVQSATQAGSAISAPTGIDTASIAGFNYNTSSYYGQWNGLLEGPRIYNRALSAVEAQQLYAVSYAGTYGQIANEIGSGTTQTTGVGSASGAGLAAAVGVTGNPSVGATSGAGAATGISANTWSAGGSSAGAGVATAIAVGGQRAVGAAVGVGVASGVGVAGQFSIGTASGTGVATGVSPTLRLAIGQALGLGRASGITNSIANTIASALGYGQARGVGTAVGRALPFDLSRAWSIQIYGSVIEGTAYDPLTKVLRVFFNMTGLSVDIGNLPISVTNAIEMSRDPQAYVLRLLAAARN